MTEGDAVKTFMNAQRIAMGIEKEGDKANR